MSDNPNNSNSNPSNNFEVRAKADEWMDITPTEEVLGAELDRLRNEFAKCAAQLATSRLETDLLRDQVSALETAVEHSTTNTGRSEQRCGELTSALRSETERSEALSHQLEADTASAEARIQRSATDLAAAASGLAVSETALAKARTRHAAETEGLRAALTAAEGEAASDRDRYAKQSEQSSKLHHQALAQSKAETETHRSAAVRFAADLRTVRQEHCGTKALLDAATEKLRNQYQLLASARNDTRTIAVLAETRSEKCTALETELERSRSEATDARAAANTAEGRGTALAEELEHRLGDLEALGTSHEQLQIELKDAERNLRTSHTRFDSDTASLRTDLAESLAECRDALDRAHRDVHATHLRLEASEAAKHITELGAERRLRRQRDTFEDRLAQLHAILGLTFAKAVRSEVSTGASHTTAIVFDQLKRRSMKVPLLLS